VKRNPARIERFVGALSLSIMPVCGKQYQFNLLIDVAKIPYNCQGCGMEYRSPN
jgi:hypothetical protein